MSEATPNEQSSSESTPDGKNPGYQVSVERTTDVERKLAVEVPWDKVKSQLDEAYQELGKGVTIKGFRRGRVPMNLLKKMFGDAVTQEVTQRLVQESIAQVVEDEDITPVATPDIEPETIVDGQAFRYTAIMQVVPEIEPKDYFDVEVEQRSPKVTDEALEQALKEKQFQQTQYKTIEGRKTQKGDVLLVDIMGKVGDEPVSLEKKMVELADEPHEPIPGLAAKLLDIEPTEQDLDIELEVPGADADAPPLAATLLVTVTDAKEKIVPALDDEFARDTGEAETLDELKDKLRQELLVADEERIKGEAKDSLIDALLAANEVPVVPALVERQLEQMRMLQRAFFGEVAESDGFDERFQADAEKTVRSGILIQAIGKKEQIEVTDEDVEQKLVDLASARGQSVARLRAEYEKEGRIEQLRRAAREEKTIELLMSKRKVVVKDSDS